MVIDYDKLIRCPFEDVHHRYTRRDTMLYPLGIGLAAGPTDEPELRFVYENNLVTLPVVLDYPGMWLKKPASGVDVLRLVHSEPGIVIHQLPAPEDEVIDRTRVTGTIDKGSGKGALLYTQRSVTEAASGGLLVTLSSTIFCRAGRRLRRPERARPAGKRTAGPGTGPHARPPHAAERLLDLLRVGQLNRLHTEPALATFGIVGWAITKGLCRADPTGLASIETRFSSQSIPAKPSVPKCGPSATRCSSVSALSNETSSLSRTGAPSDADLPFPIYLSISRRP